MNGRSASTRAACTAGMVLVIVLAAATQAWAGPEEDTTGPGAKGKSDPAFVDEVVRRRREAQER